MIADRIPDIQQALAEADLDGWFFACFQHNDPVSHELLGLAENAHVSRRCYYLLPREGEPKMLVHELEPAQLDHLPGSKSTYLTWQRHAEALAELVSGCRRLAAHYSPDNNLPSISRLDAGTAERLRSLGIELVSAAELVQEFAAAWSEEQLAGHCRACGHLHTIVLEAFQRVGATLRGGREIDEYSLQRFIVERFGEIGLWSDVDPIVGVNANSADPHYSPPAQGSKLIREGDFLLIDLFAKEKTDQSVFADITWTAVCAAAPTDRQQEIFDTVAAARDAGVALIRERYPDAPVHGWEVDDATRKVIADAGYGDAFIHRTGHSIGVQIHGHGANMDNLETHDTRPLRPMTGFSIEPGIYFPGDFGVRSEINVALTPTGVQVTGGEPQRELVRILA